MRFDVCRYLNLPFRFTHCLMSRFSIDAAAARRRRECVTTTMTDVATRLHPTAPHAKRPNACYAKCLPLFVIICRTICDHMRYQCYRDQAHQHHVNTGFLPLTISSRSTMTFLRLPSMSSLAAYPRSPSSSSYSSRRRLSEKRRCLLLLSRRGIS
jgi:hypothetical protein